MPAIRFVALPTEIARRYQSGGTDANGAVPERHPAAGEGYPCRHCLRDIPVGAPFLVLAHRPFPAPQPYAEQGPIFLCAEPCERHPATDALPPIFRDRAQLLLRGYGSDDRIVYGTGKVVPMAEITSYAEALLSRPEVAYVHGRSASNNCYQVRIERG